MVILSIERGEARLRPFRFWCHRPANRFGAGWFLLCWGLLFALPGLAWRWHHEAAPGVVQITTEWEDTRYCAEAWGMPHARLLAELRRGGVRSGLVGIQNLISLRDNGRLCLLTRGEAQGTLAGVSALPAAYNWVAMSADRSLLDQLQRWLRVQCPLSPPRRLEQGAVALAMGRAELLEWPVGFDSTQVAGLRRAGLGVSVRLTNPFNLSPALLRMMLSATVSVKANAVFFDDEVLGNDSLVPLAAAGMRRRRLPAVSLEGARPPGQDALLSLCEGMLVRAHVIGPREAGGLSPGPIIERYVRAARERNIRVLLVRMVRTAKGGGNTTGHAVSLNLVNSIARELQFDPEPWRGLRPRLVLGEARPVGANPDYFLRRHLGSVVAPWLAWSSRFACGVATLGAVLLLAECLTDWTARIRAVAVGAGLVGAAAVAVSAQAGPKILALLAAASFPLVGLLWGGGQQSWITRGASLRASDAGLPGRLTLILLRTTALTFAGGLVVAGLLGDWTFWTAVSEFSGTKAAGLLTLTGACVFLLGEYSPSPDPAVRASDGNRRLRLAFRRALDASMTARGALVSLAIGIVVLLWLARSGNDSGLTVPTWEWKFRALLEQVFVARPRSKEFLVCHPAFLAGLFFLARGQRKLGGACLLLGCIGQADVINSFAQANDPLYIPVWRSLLGLVLGCVVAAMALVFSQSVRRVARRRTGHSSADATACPNSAFERSALVISARLAAGTVALLIIVTGGTSISRHRAYDRLTAPSSEAHWPWPGIAPEKLHRGVTHWFDARAADGTSAELFCFDFAANPGLKLSLYDQTLASAHPNSDRFDYWSHGVGPVARRLNRDGKLVALWNGAFFGLTNAKPRAADRAFHVSPVVEAGQVAFPRANHRWTWGVKYHGHRPLFGLLHLPSAATLSSSFDFATGGLQALVQDGQPLKLRPFPWFGERPEIGPASSREAGAGHIPVLDHLKTSRCSVGWTAADKLYLLFVKEPDSEDASRRELARRVPAHGGWTLADEQAFWLSARQTLGVRDAVGLDGGDVAQLAYRHGAGFTVVPPRMVIGAGTGTQRLTTIADFAGGTLAHGGALNYFYMMDNGGG